MNPALNPKTFPKNGLIYLEVSDGWYVAETKSGDFVAFHVNNDDERLFGYEFPNGVEHHKWVDITDHMNKPVDTVSFTQYALLKED